MKIKIFILSLLCLTLFGLNQNISHAQDVKYKVLAPLPGTTETCTEGGKNCETTLQKYLPGVFNLAIGLSATFAMFMIVIGGFQYMTSDALQGKSEGRQRIENAIKGLLLVIGAWLILNTVNPELLKLNFSVQKISLPAPAPVASSTGGGLSTGTLQQSTQTAVNALRAECSGCVNITSTTGGSHTPNSLHYQGLAVDIAPNSALNQYLVGSTAAPAKCRYVDKILGGQSVRFLWEPKGETCGGKVPSSGDHWHMSIRNN